LQYHLSEMTGRAGQTREYHSPRCRAQAQATRQLIVDVAYVLVDQGYGRTRISAIPALARVSPETVSTYLETKPAMLACILEVALEGPGDRFAPRRLARAHLRMGRAECCRKIELLAKL
jgi:AcrR family transcriptional regulator